MGLEYRSALEALASSPWANDQAVPFGGAGSSRMVDAIEPRWDGHSVPGLTALLWRSGVKDVVVQNDLSGNSRTLHRPCRSIMSWRRPALNVSHNSDRDRDAVIDIPTVSLVKTESNPPFRRSKYRRPPPAGKKGPRHQLQRWRPLRLPW